MVTLDCVAYGTVDRYQAQRRDGSIWLSFSHLQHDTPHTAYIEDQLMVHHILYNNHCSCDLLDAILRTLDWFLGSNYKWCNLLLRNVSGNWYRCLVAFLIHVASCCKACFCLGSFGNACGGEPPNCDGSLGKYLSRLVRFACLSISNSFTWLITQSKGIITQYPSICQDGEVHYA
jgi:hypothetical protein